MKYRENICAEDPVNFITEQILDSCFKIHKMYGPGLLESAYEQILVYELTAYKKLKVETQKTLPIIHESLTVNAAYRIDLLVENQVIVELKAHEKILPVHEAQLLTYLKLSGKRVGLIINFNAKMLKEGIRRLVL